MLETIITAVIIVGAAAWFVRWLKGAASGDGSCACGKCAKNCPAKSVDCLKAGDR